MSVSLPPPLLDFTSLRRMRWKDADYKAIHDYLKDGSFPAGASDSQKKSLRTKAKHFQLNKDDKIVLVVNEVPPWARVGNEAKYDVRLPFEMRIIRESDVPKVIKKFYGDILTNGYSGIRKFHDRIQEQFIGITFKDVEAQVQSFQVHQVQMPSDSEKIVRPIRTERKMQLWVMDLIDLSGIQHKNNGIHWVLNIVDHFSKFAWARGLKNKSAQSVAFALQDIILQEGSPEKLASDNGGEFDNALIAQLCAEREIDQRFGSPYEPRSQGLVERFNKTLKEKINRYLADHSSMMYIDKLQFIVFSYNTQKHSTTGEKPFVLHRGIDPKYNMVNALAAEKLNKAADKMKADSEKKQQEKLIELDVGDSVRVGTFALKSTRKMVKFVRRAAGLTSWSKVIYTVTEMKTDEHGIVLHRIEPTPPGEDEDRWYHRHHLMKVDLNNMVKPKSISDKQDLNFGMGPFDREVHLQNLQRRDRRAVEMSQAEVDAHAASAAAAGPRRTGRAGAGRNDEFYANNPGEFGGVEWE